MFTSSSKPHAAQHSKPHHHAPTPKKRTRTQNLDIVIPFSILLALSIAELVLTLHAFQKFQRNKKWYSKTERWRLGFLIFSSARTICLSTVYIGFHCALKIFHSMFHTIFVLLSTVLWIISGVLIHSMWGTIICNQGIGGLKGGLTTCHEVKIIEIVAWVLAGVSVVATVPVVRNAVRRRSEGRRMKEGDGGRKSGLSA